ncbi:hypothetical protein [Neorhodopirellula lusitana]|uniref:hypothetical protein n=1 Tax=Neorhodopirellula lusitana TaxID=445327 RepID=UPI00384C0D14
MSNVSCSQNGMGPIASAMPLASACDPAEEVMPSEIETLTWAFIDEAISPADYQRLEQLLLESEDMRKVYLDICGLHEAMLGYFGQPSDPVVNSRLGLSNE